MTLTLILMIILNTASIRRLPLSQPEHQTCVMVPQLGLPLASTCLDRMPITICGHQLDPVLEAGRVGVRLEGMESVLMALSLRDVPFAHFAVRGLCNAF
jgi:hypothetical protein